MHTGRCHEHQFSVGRATAVSDVGWFGRESRTAEEFALQRVQCGVQVGYDPQALRVSLVIEALPEQLAGIGSRDKDLYVSGGALMALSEHGNQQRTDGAVGAGSDKAEASRSGKIPDQSLAVLDAESMLLGR
ncbi:hypothetical protein [Streptomyces umbrinus]|uniref:hypothetical protein n=1 Tax=Streptomyces umbrinus TaxID=67370 RepID=UPI003C2B37E1